MSNEAPALAGASPSAEEQNRALHQEEERLRHTIIDLLAQVDTLREARKSNDALEDLVLQLREANQNLVLATFGAQDQQAAAEAANRVQEEFLSMLAHELRNPLAPIATAAALLGKVLPAHPQLPKLHGVICRQVHHMTHLIDDLLDVSRVRSGKITLKKSALLLSEIIDSAVETSQPFIDSRKQSLVLDLPDYPVIVDGDLVRLSQVFSNLLINATKFTPEGGHIIMSAALLASVVTVSVQDDGVGVAMEIQPFIFDLFTQGAHAIDREKDGLGIGLSLVRTIVEMHGGTATVRSAGTGCGSEFIVLLPLSAAHLPDDPCLPAIIALPGRYSNILLIDDNTDATDTLKNFLVLEGHRVDSASDGQSGIEMAKAHCYDVIICDIGLPGTDGYEVVSHLRSHLPQPMPCFIAITGYNQLEKRIRAIDVGFDHYLVKPIAMDILLNLIALAVLH